MAEVVLIEAVDGYTHVAVRGRLDAAGVGEIDLKLTSQTAARRKPAVIDFNDVTYIASLGIGMLVGIAKALGRHGAGAVIVVGPTPVRSVLESTNLNDLIPIVATRDEALQALSVS